MKFVREWLNPLIELQSHSECELQEIGERAEEAKRPIIVASPPTPQAKPEKKRRRFKLNLHRQETKNTGFSLEGEI